MTSRRATLLAAAVSLAVLPGCVSENGLPPVFGAVFGLEGSASAPFTVGTIPDPAVQPGDRIIGMAANNPGQCIYFRGNTNRRFRADCPEGYEL